jgi:GNAT superfamily N-acetyltransferase
LKLLALDFLPISSKFEVNSFDCGEPALDEFLKSYARQNHDRKLSRTFVALEKSSNKVLGYYTVIASEIDAQTIPKIHSKHLPRYPVPVMRVGKLAVDKKHKGRGIGAELLWDVLRRANHLSDEVGIFAVVVDAKGADAVAFYLKYGFLPLSDDPKTLFLPIKIISSLFEKGDQK